MESNVHEAGTGAVRSVEVANERWDLMSGFALRKIKRVSNLEPYGSHPIDLFDRAIDYCYAFLGGTHEVLLEKAAFDVMVGISLLDHPACYKELMERFTVTEYDRCMHLPYWGLIRLATTCDEGAVKYGEENWLHGFQVKSLLNHAIRHLRKWIAGDNTEDHLGHALWNIVAAIHMFHLRPDMATLLLGRDWTITPDIQRYHDEHSSRRRLSKAERSRRDMDTTLSGEGLATDPIAAVQRADVVQSNGQGLPAASVAHVAKPEGAAGSADPFLTLPHGSGSVAPSGGLFTDICLASRVQATAQHPGHGFRDGWRADEP